MIPQIAILSWIRQELRKRHYRIPDSLGTITKGLGQTNQDYYYSIKFNKGQYHGKIFIYLRDDNAVIEAGSGYYSRREHRVPLGNPNLIQDLDKILNTIRAQQATAAAKIRQRRDKLDYSPPPALFPPS